MIAAGTSVTTMAAREIGGRMINLTVTGTTGMTEKKARTSATYRRITGRIVLTSMWISGRNRNTGPGGIAIRIRACSFASTMNADAIGTTGTTTKTAPTGVSWKKTIGLTWNSPLPIADCNSSTGIGATVIRTSMTAT